MKGTFILMLIVLITCPLNSQELNIVSWNLKDFGKTRTDDDIDMIANVIQEYDIIAIQEVVAKDRGGVKAVERLCNQLNAHQTIWKFIYSQPTNSPSGNISERYAFLYKETKVSLITAYLIEELESYVNREPYVASFDFKGIGITIVNYHACTHQNHYPERQEIKYVTAWLRNEHYSDVVFVGDMNLNVNDKGFDSLKNSFENVFNGEKTSLKEECVFGNYLSKAEDNIFYSLNNFRFLNGKAINFIGTINCESVSWKRNSFSDHLPILIKLGI